jgi:hypothetical protein
MSRPRRNTDFLSLADTLFAVKHRKSVSHQFVLDAIAALSPETRSMFGCLAIYVQDKIVLVLRDKRDHTADNGVWSLPPKTSTRVCGGSSPICDPSKCWGRR